MKRIVLVIVIALCVGVLGWAIYRKASAVKADAVQASRPAIAVEIAPLSRMSLQDKRMFTGNLVADSYFIVAPKVAGRLEKLTVDIGDVLDDGQMVAQLDREEYEQQVQQAQAELAVSHAQLEQSEASLESILEDLRRDRSLREQKIISQSDLDKTEAAYKVARAAVRLAKATVDQKQAMLRAAEVRLSYSSITVTWNGNGGYRVVGEKFVDVGAMLRANDPILSVVDISKLKAVVQVPERDLASIRLGQEVEITTDAVAGRTFRGTIKRLAPLVQESSRQVRVEVEVPNDERVLTPGLFVRAWILFDEHQDALTVPREAVTKRQGKTGIFLADIEGMTAKFIPITQGIVQEGVVEILDPGDLQGTVVTLGQHLLTEGAAIRVPALEGRGAGAGAPR